MDSRYREVTHSTKAKSGKIYTYKRLIPVRTNKGIERVSKSGRRYLNYYNKLGSREGIGLGLAKYSLINLAKAKERDNYTCQICGKTNTRLHVHHKDNHGVHLTPKPNNELNNLVTLCAGCHTKLHFGTLYKYENVVGLREEGLTLAEIGKICGVSRQRIHKVLAKNNRPTLQ